MRYSNLELYTGVWLRSGKLLGYDGAQYDWRYRV